jgi:hypothetical protein
MCPDAGCPPHRRLTDYRNGTLFWSDPLTWGNGTAPGALPADGDDVTVPFGWYLVLDVATPRLRSLTIEGTMVFAPLDLGLTAGCVQDALFWRFLALLLSNRLSLFQVAADRCAVLATSFSRTPSVCCLLLTGGCCLPLFSLKLRVIQLSMLHQPGALARLTRRSDLSWSTTQNTSQRLFKNLLRCPIFDLYRRDCKHFHAENSSPTQPDS